VLHAVHVPTRLVHRHAGADVVRLVDHVVEHAPRRRDAQPHHDHREDDDQRTNSLWLEAPARVHAPAI
jgi:hypothetical protein